MSDTIIYTCPKCGGDLETIVLASNPPQNVYRCNSCGWEHTYHNKIIRVPFQENEQQVINLNYSPPMQNYNPCENCSNRPKDGNISFCHCTLPTPVIY